MGQAYENIWSHTHTHTHTYTHTHTHTHTHTYRLYRAQRLYVQLLPKSMLLAILIGNGIRLQSTIALCPEKVFFMSYFTRHKGCMSISGKSSEHKGCMSTLICALRESADVIIHDVNSRPVGMLRVRPS